MTLPRRRRAGTDPFQLDVAQVVRADTAERARPYGDSLSHRIGLPDCRRQPIARKKHHQISPIWAVLADYAA